MKKTAWVLSVCVVLAMTCSASAQTGKGSGPRFYGDFKPVVGGWAEYEMKMRGEQPTRLKIAVVAKEGNSFWYETVMDMKGEGRMVTKMLVSGNPDDPGAVKRMIMKMGNEPAMEMPVGMTGMAGKEQAAKGKFLDKGVETVKVPAGTFKAQHMQYQDQHGTVDTWFSKDVSPYGTVKTATKEMEMVLLAYGTGAKTLITETPQKFDMPAMEGMQEKKPRRK